jgi:hypothetical protein
MTPENDPCIDRIYYEAHLYGHDVYYEFAQYCFWRNVVRTQFADWLLQVPAYFLPRPIGQEDVR